MVQSTCTSVPQQPDSHRARVDQKNGHNGRRLKNRSGRSLAPRPPDGNQNEWYGQGNNHREEETESVNFDQKLEGSESADDDFEAADIAPNFETIDASLDEQARTHFLEQLPQADKRGPHIPSWMFQITGNLKDSTVLAQLAYWTDPDHAHPPNRRRRLPKPWTAKSSQDLAAEVYCTTCEVDKILSRLRKKRLVAWCTRKFGGKRKRHI